MKTATGHITVVQEQRFLLMTEAGRGFLLTLAHNASVDAEALHQFHQSHVPVVVSYTGEPNLDSGVAHNVRSQAQPT